MGTAVGRTIGLEPVPAREARAGGRMRTESPEQAGRRPERAIAGFMLAYIALSPVLARSEHVVCPFRRLTGHRCPLCGLTRSLAALTRGNVRASVAEHPFGWLVAVRVLLAAVRELAAWERTALHQANPI